MSKSFEFKNVFNTIYDKTDQYMQRLKLIGQYFTDSNRCANAAQCLNIDVLRLHTNNDHA